MAKALGLTTADQQVVLRSFSAEDPDTKITFQIFLIPKDGGYIVGRLDEAHATGRIFRLDRLLHLIRAVAFLSASDSQTAIPDAEAQKLWDATRRQWARSLTNLARTAPTLD